MKEYKVIVDKSNSADNNPEAIAKKMNELAAAGWQLSHVTSFSSTANTSKVYCVFERETP